MPNNSNSKSVYPGLAGLIGQRAGGGASRGRSEQLAWEKEMRRRLGAPAVLAGVLYLLSGIIISSTLNGAPTVGVLQGIAPALKGVANPHVSPRAAEVDFISHHAFPLIAGSVMSALALIALAAILLLLAKAARYRRPESWAAAAPLAVVGAIGFGIVGLAHQVGSAVLAHNFATGTDFTNAAVERTLTTGPVNVAAQYVSLIAGLALVVGMIATCVSAMKVGLLQRWMGVVGIIGALLIFLPIGGATLEIVPAFWMAAIGLLYMGRWSGAELPAWSSGEAHPWPSQAEVRARQQAERGAKGRDRRASRASKVSANGEKRLASGNGKPPTESGLSSDVEQEPAGGEPAVVSATAPAPTPVRSSAQKGKRRRKRGSRS